MSNTINIKNLLNKSRYYNYIHNDKYEHYKYINKLFLNTIIVNTFFNQLLIRFFKEFPYLSYYTFISHTLTVIIMITMIWTYQQEDVHKYSTDTWYRYILYLKSIEDSNIDEIKYLLANYNYSIYSKYSKIYITRQDINEIKLKYNLDLSNIDDFIKEIIY